MGNKVGMARRKDRLPVDKKQTVVIADKKGQPFDWETLLAGISRGKTVLE